MGSTYKDAITFAKSSMQSVSLLTGLFRRTAESIFHLELQKYLNLKQARTYIKEGKRYALPIATNPDTESAPDIF